MALALPSPHKIKIVGKALFHPDRQRDPIDVERHLTVRKRYTHVIGCDESGTGCLSGPVVAASCTLLRLPNSASQSASPELPSLLLGVDDSKRLSASERDRIYLHVTSRPDLYLWSITVRSNQQIDEAPSLLNSTLEACHESIENVISQLSSSGVQSDKNRIYCIVDGQKTPRVSVTCRQWPRGDANVYTVALASVLARVARDRIVEDLQKRHPEHAWSLVNGGYASKAHTQALHRFGPSPFHRATCRPVRSRQQTVIPRIPRDYVGDSRAEFVRFSIKSSALILFAHAFMSWAPTKVQAMTTDSKTGIALPDLGEIESAVPPDWVGIDNPFEGNPGSAFSRLDSSRDAEFYQEPRFVEHVDLQAVQLMTDYISHVAIPPGTRSVLDLCSSWTSHYSPQSSTLPVTRFAGLGMNAQELQRNTALTEWVVQDLNQDSRLPYVDDSFDCVLCQLSIDYLTQPLKVCREISRVLAPGGAVHILFSNRLFLSKAVAIWTGADDVDHAFIVASYLHFSGGNWENIQAMDLSKRGRDKRIVGDPLYVVTATKSGRIMG